MQLYNKVALLLVRAANDALPIAYLSGPLHHRGGFGA
jgi:hypothetical protein